MEPEQIPRLQPASLEMAQEELASSLLANGEYTLVRTPADGGCWDDGHLQLDKLKNCMLALDLGDPLPF